MENSQTCCRITLYIVENNLIHSTIISCVILPQSHKFSIGVVGSLVI